MPDGTLNQLLTEHAADIEAVVVRYVDDELERDDLRQEIVIAIWRAAPRFAGRSSQRTYVMRIARNRAASFCLARARRRALFDVLDDDVPVDATITGEFEARQLGERVTRALGHLSHAQREVLTLAVAGNSPAEIARAAGRSSGTVRVALHRARAILRRLLTPAERER